MKSKFLTLFLSAVPGVGHYYLGLMNRGLQFMLSFGVCVMLIILTHIEAISILLPIIWFYSLFDALQHRLLVNEGIIEDTSLPFWNQVYINQKWIAYLFIGIGAYIILERLLQITSRFFDMFYYYDLRTFVVAIIFIFIGYRLLSVSREKNTEQSAKQEGDVG